MFDAVLQHPEIIGIIFSAFATGFAAFATWMGPRSAAKLAEQLRKNTEAHAEQRRLKLWVFTTLMQERAMIWSADSVRALNLIDIIFKDNQQVREAWAELYLAYGTKDIPSHVQEERLRALLKAMASDLDLNSGLRLDDFGRVYYPNALAEENAVRRMEVQQALQRLAPNASPTANTTPSPPSPYPPKPSDQ
jgi:hypothetical protein